MRPYIARGAEARARAARLLGTPYDLHRGLGHIGCAHVYSIAPRILPGQY